MPVTLYYVLLRCRCLQGETKQARSKCVLLNNCACTTSSPVRLNLSVDLLAKIYNIFLSRPNKKKQFPTTYQPACPSRSTKTGNRRSPKAASPQPRLLYLRLRLRLRLASHSQVPCSPLPSRSHLPGVLTSPASKPSQFSAKMGVSSRIQPFLLVCAISSVLAHSRAAADDAIFEVRRKLPLHCGGQGQRYVDHQKNLEAIIKY